MSANVVMGTAIGYGPDEMRYFVKTLRSLDRECEVYLVVSSNIKSEIRNFMSQYEIRPIYFSAADCIPTLVHNSRYLRYLDECLRLMKIDEKSRILLTDVRDVFFTRPPFQDLPAGEFIWFAMEKPAIPIGHEPHNKKWILDIFGENVFDKLKNLPISCSGTTLGSVTQIFRYLVAQKDLLCQVLNKKPELARTALDQGFHNFILHTASRMFENVSFLAPGNYFLTLGLYENREVGWRAGLPTLYSEKIGSISVVHQYDRHPQLGSDVLDFVERLP